MALIERGDYTQRDRAGIEAEIKEYIARVYPGVDVDFTEGSISLESMLKDMVVHASDGNHMYIDAAHSEHYCDTACEDQSLMSLAKIPGCPIQGRAAAVADLSYTYTKLDVTAPASVILATGTAIVQTSGMTWTVATPLQAVSEGTGTFEAHQGTFVTDSFVATSAPNQSCTPK